MIKNILIQITRLSLTLGFLLNLSFATEIPHDDELSHSRILMTAEQVSPLNIKDNFKNVHKTVFSGAILLHISSYLGRLEVGRMQQVSKSIKHFFIEGNESLLLWKGYAQQLQLDIKKNINFETLRSYIKDYYTSRVYSLPIPHQTRFEDMVITCFDFKESIFAGYAKDKQNHNYKTAIMCKNGQIISLCFLNNGNESEAKAISSNNHIITIVGAAKDGQNNKVTAVKWENGQIISLEKLSNGYTAAANAISADGRVIVGVAWNGDNRLAIKWEDGKIKFLSYFNNGVKSEATAINANARIIGGLAEDGQNGNKLIPVKWIDEKIKPLSYSSKLYIQKIKFVSEDGGVIMGLSFDGANRIIDTIVISKGQNRSLLNYPYFKKFQTQFCIVIALASNGSDFIVKLQDNKLYYKVHLPRYDLWKMK